jgi:hypothetical protein
MITGSGADQANDVEVRRKQKREVRNIASRWLESIPSANSAVRLIAEFTTAQPLRSNHRRGTQPLARRQEAGGSGCVDPCKS